MPDLPYIFEALFAVFRIGVWFILLFLFIAPLFLRHIRELPAVEKIIYSWVGIGGTIILAIFLLTLFHIYDFISFVVFLLLTALVVDIVRHRQQGIRTYFKRFELDTVVSHVRFIEGYHKRNFREWMQYARDRFRNFGWGNPYAWMAFTIALVGGGTRMAPALDNASPLSRSWYLHLNRIKNLRLQEYFPAMPEPGGMHSLVSLFSMLTQVSPEMILHLLGALTSFFLCIIVFWSTKDLTKNEYPLAPIFAMSIYALAPMLFLPISLDQQIQGNSLDLALCFAIPTITIYVRNLRRQYRSPRFYMIMGVFATAFTNLFVALAVLVPVMFICAVTIPRRNYLRSLGRQFFYILASTGGLLLPFVGYLWFYDLDMLSFFRERFFDTTVYSYFPLLITDLSELSRYYALTAAVLLVGNIIRYIGYNGKGAVDESIILAFFLGLSLLYLPEISFDLYYLDPDQLNGFYALLISILFGLFFANAMRFINWGIRYHKAAITWIERLALAGSLAAVLYLQGGLQVSRVLPSTLPNGFFEAYYQIINTHLPYSYATVGPEIDQTLAKNRHYFMNYTYFLDEYGNIDRQYREWLSVPEQERESQSIPPSSIFIFVEKPPYGAIQQGILYNSGSVMQDLEQWIEGYRRMENRRIKTYYETEGVIVYELINRTGESLIWDVLLNIHASENGEADG